MQRTAFNITMAFMSGVCLCTCRAIEDPRAESAMTQTQDVEPALRDLHVASTTPIKGDVMEIALDEGVTVTLVWIEPGAFTMGSPASEAGRNKNETLHDVRIERGFWMGQTEVTKGQFRRFIDKTGYVTVAEQRGDAGALNRRSWGWTYVDGASWRNAGFFQPDEHPAICIARDDAKAFCQWLSERYGGRYRLPSEAEWEYACRAGTQTAYFWGDDPNDGEYWCNALDESGIKRFKHGTPFPWNDGYSATAPAGRFRPNAFGLHNMHGNVSEWCEDRHHDSYVGAPTDGGAWIDGDSPNFVARGGAMDFGPRGCRSAQRIGQKADVAMFNVGFRICRDPD